MTKESMLMPSLSERARLPTQKATVAVDEALLMSGHDDHSGEQPMRVVVRASEVDTWEP